MRGASSPPRGPVVRPLPGARGHRDGQSRAIFEEVHVLARSEVLEAERRLARAGAGAGRPTLHRSAARRRRPARAREAYESAWAAMSLEAQVQRRAVRPRIQRGGPQPLHLRVLGRLADAHRAGQSCSIRKPDGAAAWTSPPTTWTWKVGRSGWRAFCAAMRAR